ncbi:hypothetical protein M422DRAFT_261657 [Sphaerobolus stellatus SS14]|uniref:Uncharacterized protein n=1 Tax=Sphaerobolus stellatus (strain SS14) TaxID=990650 RepID=A0A0C9UMN4_SPHS4|nr:hypothetical protein M422DRAFT_261657 [Sphaerobolus stellatus SS14]
MEFHGVKLPRDPQTLSAQLPDTLTSSLRQHRPSRTRVNAAQAAAPPPRQPTSDPQRQPAFILRRAPKMRQNTVLQRFVPNFARIGRRDAGRMQPGDLLRPTAFAPGAGVRPGWGNDLESDLDAPRAVSRDNKDPRRVPSVRRLSSACRFRLLTKLLWIRPAPDRAHEEYQRRAIPPRARRDSGESIPPRGIRVSTESTRSRTTSGESFPSEWARRERDQCVFLAVAFESDDGGDGEGRLKRRRGVLVASNYVLHPLLRPPTLLRTVKFTIHNPATVSKHDAHHPELICPSTNLRNDPYDPYLLSFLIPLRRAIHPHDRRIPISVDETSFEETQCRI